MKDAKIYAINGSLLRFEIIYLFTMYLLLLLFIIILLLLLLLLEWLWCINLKKRL